MAHSSTNFSCKVSSKLKIWDSFGIEVARLGIYLSQIKSFIDLLNETGIQASRYTYGS